MSKRKAVQVKNIAGMPSQAELDLGLHKSGYLPQKIGLHREKVPRDSYEKSFIAVVPACAFYFRGLRIRRRQFEPRSAAQPALDCALAQQPSPLIASRAVAAGYTANHRHRPL